jgi:hypothetical protein
MPCQVPSCWIQVGGGKGTWICGVFLVLGIILISVVFFFKSAILCSSATLLFFTFILSLQGSLVRKKKGIFSACQKFFLAASCRRCIGVVASSPITARQRRPATFSQQANPILADTLPFLFSYIIPFFLFTFLPLADREPTNFGHGRPTTYTPSKRQRTGIDGYAIACLPPYGSRLAAIAIFC